MLLTCPNDPRVLNYDGEASRARSLVDNIICRSDSEVVIERL